MKKYFIILSIGLIASFLSVEVFAAQNQVSIRQQGEYRIIESNGIADHLTGTFPNSGNPNIISPQKHSFRIPMNPKLTQQEVDARPYWFGVAVNGVPFEPGTGEFWNNKRGSKWNYEALTGKIDLGLDQNNAHVQPTGAYHYHGIPNGLVRNLNDKQTSPLIGYAADGFKIYSVYGFRKANDSTSQLIKVRSSYRLRNGIRPSGPGGRFDGTYGRDFEFIEGLGDLDECNGRVGITPDGDENVYHYYLTNDFPFAPRCFKGRPDASFKKRGRQNLRDGLGPNFDLDRNQRLRGGGRRSPPQEAVMACQGKSTSASCTINTPHGKKRGFCQRINNITACVPKR